MGKHNSRVRNYLRQKAAAARGVASRKAAQHAQQAQPPPTEAPAVETPAKPNPYRRMLDKLDADRAQREGGQHD